MLTFFLDRHCLFPTQGTDGNWTSLFASAMCGSPDIYMNNTPLETDWWGSNGGRKWKGNRGPQHSVNFITAHDGFTLADLVAYNEKKNAANGEDNRCVHVVDMAAMLHGSMLCALLVSWQQQVCLHCMLDWGPALLLVQGQTCSGTMCTPIFSLHMFVVNFRCTCLLPTTISAGMERVTT